MEEKITATNKLLARAYQAYPVPPETRRFEETMAKVLEERELYKNMPELKKSLNVRELDQAIALMGRLKISEKDFATLQWRASQMAVQLPIMRALGAVDTSHKIAEDNEKQILSLKNLIDTCQESGLGKVDPAKWLDPETAQIFAKVLALYEDVMGRIDAAKLEAQRQREQREREAEEERQRVELEAAKKQAEAEGDAHEVSKIRGTMRRMTRARMTITNMTPLEQDQICRKLADAVLEFDQKAISDLLETAVTNGIDPGELAEARELFKSLHSEEFVKTELNRAFESVTSQVVSHQDRKERNLYMKQCTNLLVVAKSLNVDRDILERIERLLRQDQGRRGTMFGAGATKRDLDAALTVYGDASTCPLCNPRVVKTIRLEDGTVFHPMERGGILSHSRTKLPGPLSILPETYAQSAMSVYRNILGWMNDRPVTEAKRMPLAYAIVFKARNEPLLRTEIYLQLIKQINNNPNKRSELLGWKVGTPVESCVCCVWTTRGSV